jgi:hypothetical protein
MIRMRVASSDRCSVARSSRNHATSLGDNIPDTAASMPASTTTAKMMAASTSWFAMISTRRAGLAGTSSRMVWE